MTPQISAKFDRGYPKQRCHIEVGSIFDLHIAISQKKMQDI